jgi:hypothetical protein
MQREIVAHLRNLLEAANVILDPITKGLADCRVSRLPSTSGAAGDASFVLVSRGGSRPMRETASVVTGSSAMKHR